MVNTKGQLGRLGAAALRRGFPRTHHFAQARSVFAVAAHRCAEVFDPPGSVTLWRLPESIEEEFDARWEHWLDNAPDWAPFFQTLELLQTTDLVGALGSFELVSDPDVERLVKLRRSAEGRAVPLQAFSRERITTWRCWPLASLAAKLAPSPSLMRARATHERVCPSERSLVLHNTEGCANTGKLLISLTLGFRANPRGQHPHLERAQSDNGAKRALIPIENKRSFLDVSADIMEHVDPVFYGDPKTAAMKVLGLS